MKETSNANSRFHEPYWPEGKYCIYKKGKCPKGFKEGFLFWDDKNEQRETEENNSNGVLPDGIYNCDTKIYYCCRRDGRHDQPIRLPITHPFYLIRMDGKCQQVYGMSVIDEWVRWNDENDDNKDSRGGLFPDNLIPDHRVNFCYYYKP